MPAAHIAVAAIVVADVNLARPKTLISIREGRAATVLRAIADKKRAEALVKAVDEGKVSLYVTDGGGSLALPPK